ncbi:hypothetical protein V8E53_007966 [Lactarius tabidus]
MFSPFSPSPLQLGGRFVSHLFACSGILPFRSRLGGRFISHLFACSDVPPSPVQLSATPAAALDRLIAWHDISSKSMDQWMMIRQGKKMMIENPWLPALEFASAAVSPHTYLASLDPAPPCASISPSPVDIGSLLFNHSALSQSQSLSFSVSFSVSRVRSPSPPRRLVSPPSILDPSLSTIQWLLYLDQVEYVSKSCNFDIVLNFVQSQHVLPPPSLLPLISFSLHRLFHLPLRFTLAFPTLPPSPASPSHSFALPQHRATLRHLPHLLQSAPAPFTHSSTSQQLDSVLREPISSPTLSRPLTLPPLSPSLHPPPSLTLSPASPPPHRYRIHPGLHPSPSPSLASCPLCLPESSHSPTPTLAHPPTPSFVLSRLSLALSACALPPPSPPSPPLCELMEPLSFPPPCTSHTPSCTVVRPPLPPLRLSCARPPSHLPRAPSPPLLPPPVPPSPSLCKLMELLVPSFGEFMGLKRLLFIR